MPENHIAIDGLTPVIDTPPIGSQFYISAIVDVAGTVAANNFLSVFNPSGSGKTFTFYRVIVSPWAADVVANGVSVNIFRTTAASGGTVVTAANINKLNTTTSNSVADVRTGNPTVTTSGSSLLGFPALFSTAKLGSAGNTVAIPAGASLICGPGQGLVISQASGDVNARWNMQFLWAET